MQTWVNSTQKYNKLPQKSPQTLYIFLHLEQNKPLLFTPRSEELSVEEEVEDLMCLRVIIDLIGERCSTSRLL